MSSLVGSGSRYYKDKGPWIRCVFIKLCSCINWSSGSFLFVSGIADVAHTFLHHSRVKSSQFLRMSVLPYTKGQRSLLSPECLWLSFLKLLFLEQAVLNVKRFYSNYNETQHFLSYSSLLLNLAMQRQVSSILTASIVNIYHIPFSKLYNFTVLVRYYQLPYN